MIQYSPAFGWLVISGLGLLFLALLTVTETILYSVLKAHERRKHKQRK